MFSYFNRRLIESAEYDFAKRIVTLLSQDSLSFPFLQIPSEHEATIKLLKDFIHTYMDFNQFSKLESKTQDSIFYFIIHTINEIGIDNKHDIISRLQNKIDEINGFIQNPSAHPYHHICMLAFELSSSKMHKEQKTVFHSFTFPFLYLVSCLNTHIPGDRLILLSKSSRQALITQLSQIIEEYSSNVNQSCHYNSLLIRINFNLGSKLGFQIAETFKQIYLAQYTQIQNTFFKNKETNTLIGNMPRDLRIELQRFLNKIYS